MRWTTLVCAAALGALLPVEVSKADLTMGMLNVGWEGTNAHNIDTGPYLFRDIPEANIVSIRTKINSQSVGNFSQAGILIRNPASAAVDGVATAEDWLLDISFRLNASSATHKSVNGRNGTDTDTDNTGLTAAAVSFLRVDRVGAGQFRLYRGTGTDDNITWTEHSVGAVTNADLAGVPLEVGVMAGDFNGGAGGTTNFDWVEIQTTAGTYFDDFSYNHDFGAGGVPGFNPAATTGGGIWNDIFNATRGGVNTTAAFLSCTSCTWNTNAGDWNNPANWAGGITEAPSGDNVVATFASSLTQPVTTVYTDVGVTVKELQFNNANKYVLAGPAQITLDADTGNALVTVLAGGHEIQVPLSLADDVTATAAAGATLNINATVQLNGHQFNISGPGAINLNNSTIAAGSGAGTGSLVNEGTLAGLASVEGNLLQTEDGTLGVVAGGAAIQVDGAAVLDGVLDVSLADGFVPVAGTTYTVLAADNVTDMGLSLGGSAASMFKLSKSDTSIGLTAVPEPVGLASFLWLGLAACFAYWRQVAR